MLEACPLRQAFRFGVYSRSRLIGDRTAVINQVRGFLLEYGIAVRQGPRSLRQQLGAWAPRRLRSHDLEAVVRAWPPVLSLTTASQIASASAMSFFCRLSRVEERRG